MTDAIDRVLRPIAPGPEMDALARFHVDVTWTGTIEAGGMGPGTPAMTATGRGTHEWCLLSGVGYGQCRTRSPAGPRTMGL